MKDGVFGKGLDGKRRHQAINMLVNRPFDLQTLAESFLFDVQIGAEQVEFFT